MLEIEKEPKNTNKENKDIPSLFDMTLIYFLSNQQKFTTEELLKLPYGVQDLLVEMLLLSEPIFGCPLDIFLSPKTYRLSLPMDSNAVTDVLIGRVAQRCNEGLKQLFLSGLVHLGDRTLETIAFNCPNLRVLDLSFCCNISDRGVTQIAWNCPKMKNLMLAKCCKVTHKSILQVAKCCKNIRQLDLTGTRFCEDDLIYLINNCHKLQNIILFNQPMTKSMVENLLVQTGTYAMDDEFSDNPKNILCSAIEEFRTSKLIKTNLFN